MRRLLVPILLAAALVPAAALAAPGAPSDGTVSVKNGDGKVTIVARGSFIGYCDTCTIWVNDPDPTDGPAPTITNSEVSVDLTDTKTFYRGSSMRFRMVGGFWRVVIQGKGIDLSGIGHGQVALLGAGGSNDGTYQFDGDIYRSMPDFELRFPLGTGN
jgi:hypothetical protein